MILTIGGYVHMQFPTHIVSCGGWVRNAEGKFLLVKHPRRGWECPGGQVENGEDLIQALQREVLEETGCEIMVEHLTGVYSKCQEGVQYDGVSKVPTMVIFQFTAQLVGGELEKSEEHLDIGWFGAEEALAIIGRPVHKLRFQHAVEFDGRVRYVAYTQDEVLRDVKL